MEETTLLKLEETRPPSLVGLRFATSGLVVSTNQIGTGEGDDVVKSLDLLSFPFKNLIQGSGADAERVRGREHRARHALKLGDPCVPMHAQ
eukprot:gene15594-biopygen7935